MDENIILSAKGLDLWYGPTQALKGVSMEEILLPFRSLRPLL